jgi:hypothetical protein
MEMEVSDFIEYLKIMTQNNRSVCGVCPTPFGVMPTAQNNVLHQNMNINVVSRKY